MSNTNSLRASLSVAQDDANFTFFNGEVLQPRPSAFKSTSDRVKLSEVELGSDLHADAEVLYANAFSTGDWVPLQYPAWPLSTRPGRTRSSEAGIREREAQVQVQTSRTFNADDEDALSVSLQQAAREEREEAFGDIDRHPYGDDLATEVAQQERDFGPEVEQEEQERWPEDSISHAARRVSARLEQEDIDHDFDPEGDHAAPCPCAVCQHPERQAPKRKR